MRSKGEQGDKEDEKKKRSNNKDDDEDVVVGVQITERDTRMLGWLGQVRLADVDGLSWALGALSGSGVPVSLSFTRRWVRRMFTSGFVGRDRPTFQDASVVWVASSVSGHKPPNVLRATTRHQVAVARLSARFMCAGYDWENDRRPASPNDHQADGVAVRAEGELTLIEVELTPKIDARYSAIFSNHRWRLTNEGISSVVYLCNKSSAKKVISYRDKTMPPEQAQLVQVFGILGERGELLEGWEVAFEHLMNRPILAQGAANEPVENVVIDMPLLPPPPPPQAPPVSTYYVVDED